MLSLVLLGVTGAARVAASSGFEEHRMWTAHGDQASAGFGSAVASAGDVNGDGFQDLIVGAPSHDAAAGPACGKVFVYYGSADGLPSSPSWTAEGEQTGSRFGFAVASAGDTNGDGFGDVVIGSPGYDLYVQPYPEYWIRDVGRLYVYLGSAQGLAANPTLVVDGRLYPSVGGELGLSVTAGDFNGDGFSDVVGAEFAEYVGGADVFYGSPAGPSPANSWAYGPWAGYWLGQSVAAADVNGDGYDDLMVTTYPDLYWDPTPGTNFYLGSSSGLPSVPGGFPPPGVPPDFGIEKLANVVALGDLDRDGYDDLVGVYGDPYNSDFFIHHVLYRGSPSGPIEAQTLGGIFGTPGRLALLGDLNGDGYPDVVAQDGSTFYLYLGSATGLRPISDGMGTLNGVFGGAGDVDGDGFDDLVIGDAAHERVDVYRGGTDWTFHVEADVSVQQVVDSFSYATYVLVTVVNAGPETVRVRLVDHFPPGTSPVWTCYWTYGAQGGGSASCLDPFVDDYGDIDSVMTLVPGGAIDYFVSLGTFSLPVANTASIVAPGWFVDPDPSNNQSTVVLGPAQEGLFADGFESGGLSAWSSSSASGLAVLPAAALEGQYGLQVTASPRGDAVVRDASPSGEGAYHARFRLDPNSFGTRRGSAAGPAILMVLFSGHADGSPRPLFEVLLERQEGQLFLVTRALQDDWNVIALARAAITDAPHVLDVGWRRATAEGATDGWLVLQVDGLDAATLARLDNDASGSLDRVDLGLAIDRGHPTMSPHRTVFLDSFESWRLQWR